MVYQIRYHWTLRPVPHAPPEEYLSELPPLGAVLMRFNHAYHGEFHVPLGEGELTFLLEDDFVIVFDQLPGWLGRLGDSDGTTAILFGSQGTELLLHATRQQQIITIAAESIDPENPLSPTLRAVCVPVTEFLTAWIDFIVAVLDALAAFDPAISRDEEWQNYREGIRTIAIR